MIVSTFLA